MLTVTIQGEPTKEKVALKERIENGDLFFAGKNKGKCSACAAVVDADMDKYCWKCGNALAKKQTHHSGLSSRKIEMS